MTDIVYNYFMNWYITKLIIKKINLETITHYNHLYVFINKSTDEINFNNNMKIKSKHNLLSEPTNSSYFMFKQLIKYDSSLCEAIQINTSDIFLRSIKLTTKCSDAFLNFLTEYARSYNIKQQIIQSAFNAQKQISQTATNAQNHVYQIVSNSNKIFNSFTKTIIHKNKELDSNL